VEKVCDRVGVIKEGRLILVEEIEKYRELVGKKISVVTKGRSTVVSEALKELSGVEDLNQRGAKVEFFYKGNMQRLIQHVAALEIEDLTCETPSLEDVFIRHYEV
jgi:ABC-2 type transport system ATP-binding protein